VIYEKKNGLPRFKTRFFDESADQPFNVSSEYRFIRGNFQNTSFLETQEVSFIQEVLSWLDSNTSRKHLEEELVVVHIRRGDYVETLHKASIGLLQRDYFINALTILNKLNHDLVVVSDCSNSLEIREIYDLEPKYFFGSNETDLECLRILSESRFIVGSNSTFSWWGAYLSYSRNHSRDVKFILPFPFYKTLPRPKEQLNFPGVKFIKSKFEDMS